MSNTQDNQPTQSQDTAELVQVTDVNQALSYVAQWHTNKVNTLRHMQAIPSGTEVSVNDGPALSMEGDLLKGFQMGIDVALSELGTLPFQAMPEFREEGHEGSTPD